MSQNKRFTLQSSSVSFLLKIADAVGVVLSGYIVHVIYLNEWQLSVPYRQAFLFAFLISFLLFPISGIYRSWRGRDIATQLSSLLVAWSSLMISLVVISVVLKNTIVFSRVWFFSWTIFGFFFLFFLRGSLIVFLTSLRRKGWNTKDIVIYGAGNLGKTVAERVNEAAWTGFKIVAFFDDDNTKWGSELSGIPILSGQQSLDDFVTKNGVVEVWLALPLRAEKRVFDILHHIRHKTVLIRFIPDIFNFQLLLSNSFSDIAGIATIEFNRSPMVGVNKWIKAIEDRVLAAIILLLASPVMLLIAVLIKLTSKGPVLFRQLRHGWWGQPIKVYKFRTMVVHDEADGSVTQATKNDGRVTKLGAFLRRTSLDELPQLYNVLQGRMSLVGPRPHAIAHNEYYKDLVENYFQRHQVKPGITGWAQVNGWRGETDTIDKMKKRVEYDLYYIQNWSLLLDFKILLLTIFRGFINPNAY